jgi:hypothetical protein
MLMPYRRITSFGFPRIDVGIQALRTDGDPGPDYRALEALAPR